MADFTPSFAREPQRGRKTGTSRSGWRRIEEAEPQTTPRRFHPTPGTIAWLDHHLEAWVAWKAGLITRDELIAVLRNEAVLPASLALPEIKSAAVDGGRR